MKFRYALGLMLATLIPASLLAQSSGEAVLQQSAAQSEALPVTLDFSLPSESQWLAKVNANSTFSPYSSSKAEAALGANVTSAVGNDLPPADVGQSPPSAAQAALGCGCNGSNGNGPHVASNGLVTPTDYGLPDRIISRFFGPTGRVREWLRNFEPNVYHAGVNYIEYGTQYWYSPIWLQSANAAQILPEIVRFGHMVNDPCQDRLLKGVFSVIAELDYLPITSGAGTYMIGGSGMIRYHRARNHRIVPYVQVGFGGLYTDSAGLPGSPTSSNFNFMTQVAAGSHVFIGCSGKWAIMNESSYTWIGSWGIGGPGNGYHVLGGLVGITRFFGGGNNNQN
jgi:hypothetical protein